MERCKLLAFLLCEKATAGPDGKVTLHRLFDRLIVSGKPRSAKNFSVYYKVVVTESCYVSLKITTSSGVEIPGNWRDLLSGMGPMHAVWELTSDLFNQPGPYLLELWQEQDNAQSIPLASTVLVVDKQEA